MKIDEAVSILRAHNEWRRAPAHLPEDAMPAMGDPRQIGIAIDTVCDALSATKGDAQPVAWVAADTLNSPHPGCVSSLAYMSQLDRERGREYVPLYAAPVAAQAQEAAPAAQGEPSAWHRIEEDAEVDVPLDTDLLLAWWDEWSGAWEIEANHAGSERGGWRHGRATHWMPLPPPPSEA